MIATTIATVILSTTLGAPMDTDQTLRSADSFAKDFNAAAGKPRVVAILAPT